jgi:hypothetical protein
MDGDGGIVESWPVPRGGGAPVAIAAEPLGRVGADGTPATTTGWRAVGSRSI